MKITGIDTFVVDAGWRPWQFVAVRTDEGVTGYGECSDGRMPYSVVGSAKEFEAILLDRDPRPVEARYWDMYRMARQSPGGIAAKAIAGIELALWDIKAKALGVPVYELFGGPLRKRQRVYWSHCGSSRAGNHEIIGVPPIRKPGTTSRISDGRWWQRGFTALKTNIVYPGEPPTPIAAASAAAREPRTARWTTPCIDHIRTHDRHLSAMPSGPNVDIALDLNFNFRVEAAKRICHALEDLRMMWVEVDMYEPKGLREIRESTCACPSAPARTCSPPATTAATSRRARWTCAWWTCLGTASPTPSAWWTWRRPSRSTAPRTTTTATSPPCIPCTSRP